MKETTLTRLFGEFFRTEKAAGIILIGCTALSLTLSHSPFASSYLSLWQLPLFGEDLAYWINDGLMAVFFLLVGLEIKRELYVGELSMLKKAVLPIVAAVGGMVVPALFHFSVNAGTPTQPGIGIPMATDIAFALGILSLLGNRVPPALKVFLTALAIIDDLGAIAVIALFYSSSLSATYLLLALAVTAVLFMCNRLKVTGLAVYLVGGLFLWHFVHHSGIHATIAGVILAFLIPFRKDDDRSASSRLQHLLHYPVAFAVLPLFALANTCLTLSSDWANGLAEPNSIGIMLGLLIGKPLGITACSMIGAKLGILVLPEHLQWKQIAAVSILGGVGFTMSIFITLLAFHDPSVVQTSKVAVLMASGIAGVAGYVFLRRAL